MEALSEGRHAPVAPGCRRLVMVVGLSTGSAAGPKPSRSREIIELTRAGLSDEVLLALIEIDQRVFPVDPATLKMLKDAGVSAKVIVAIVKSGRTPSRSPSRARCRSPSRRIRPTLRSSSSNAESSRGSREVAVAVPVYVAVASLALRTASVLRCSAIAVRAIRNRRRRSPHEHPKRAEPVYWGWGGKLRPDAWQPDPRRTRR